MTSTDMEAILAAVDEGSNADEDDSVTLVGDTDDTILSCGNNVTLVPGQPITLRSRGFPDDAKKGET